MRGSLRQIIFDFDGTLIDSAPDLAVAINAMLRELEYPPVTQEQIRLWIGNGAAKLVERALKARAITAISTDAALTSFYHHYHRALGQYSKLYPGVEQGLRQLHQAGFTLSLCTNKPEQFTSPLLQRFGLSSLFHYRVCGDSLKHKKPHPEPLFWLCNESRIEPRHSLMVGDSITDVRAAQAATMPVACVGYGYSQGLDLQELEVPIFDTFTSLVSTIIDKAVDAQ